MARIWIVEDDPQIGLLIELTVKKAGHEARRLVDGVELERALQKDAPELLLLDLMLREKDGFTLLREWKQRQRTKDVPVIIISARGAERDKVRGLELGAEDYVTKPFGVRELQARIQTALRRLPTEGERLEAGPLSILPKSRETFLDGRRVELTAREYELLLYLARRAGSTVTRGELLREVWGYATEEDPSRTVDAHVKTLRLKLGDTAAEPRLIRTVRGAGYRLIAGGRGMKRRLRHLYWTGIAITMVMATVAVAMMVKLKIDDSREALRSILQAASAWTMESTEDLQSMAESIASVSPPLRVTFLMEQGLVLADSEADALAMENHASRPEVQAALQGGIGESLRFSDTQAMLTLYAAMRISPALILRLSYPLWEIAGMLAMYGVGLLCLFLVLYILQRRTLGRFGKDLMLQMDEVRRPAGGRRWP